jgi:hypothetical protein
MTGVKQPLSVRKHPERDGFFIINGGSRRYRAGIFSAPLQKISISSLYFL